MLHHGVQIAVSLHGQIAIILPKAITQYNLLANVQIFHGKGGKRLSSYDIKTGRGVALGAAGLVSEQVRSFSVCHVHVLVMYQMSVCMYMHAGDRV